MIFLTATTESLTLVTAAALSLDWSAGYVDIDTTTGATPGSDQGNVSTATTTTVVAAPAASVQRQLKSFIAVNKDATLTQTVTLNKVTGAGTFALARTVALAPNETLIWVDTIGFEILDANGVHKVANTLVNLSTGVTGTLPAQYGGTGNASYAVGDLLYASGATTLSKLADVATGNALISGGVTTAPSWGKIALTTHVSGILPVANGGTGLASGTDGGVLGYTASGTLASSGVLTANRIVLGGGAGATPSVLGSLGTTTTVLHGNAAGAPTFGAVSLTADVTGTLPVANGGTGITSFGTGVATWLGTPSSANLASAMTDETGTGALVFANTPTLVTPVIGVASGTSLALAGTLTGVTDLTTTGNTILGNAQADTLNVGNGDIIKDASGNVGIGVTPGSYKLNVEGTVRLNSIERTTAGQLYINASDSAGYVTVNTNGAERMRIDSSGNVGIGKTPSDSASYGAGFLDVVSGIYARQPGTPANYVGLGVASSVASVFVGANIPLALYTNATERMRIDSSGNVGIGGAAGNKLDVFVTAAGNIIRARNNTSAFEAILGVSSDSGYLDSGNTDLALRRNGTEYVRISGSAGDVLTKVTATPPTLGTNSQMVFNLTSNTNLRISVRGTDGTTRVANITLA